MQKINWKYSDNWLFCAREFHFQFYHFNFENYYLIFMWHHIMFLWSITNWWNWLKRRKIQEYKNETFCEYIYHFNLTAFDDCENIPRTHSINSGRIIENNLYVLVTTENKYSTFRHFYCLKNFDKQFKGTFNIKTL